MGENLPPFRSSAFDLEYVGVKAPMFSFTRLKGSDPVLGVEMASTGEVACLGDDFEEAFLKSIVATGMNITPRSVLLSTGSLKNKTALLPEMRLLSSMGITLYATEGTAAFLTGNGITVAPLRFTNEPPKESIINTLDQRMIDLVINIPKDVDRSMLDNDYIIRRKAVDLNLSLITNAEFARRYIKAIHRYFREQLRIKSWDEYI
jgi:carbamoyl-phosphate synthase large subunit